MDYELTFFYKKPTLADGQILSPGKKKEQREFEDKAEMIRTLLNDQGFEVDAKCYINRFLAIYVYSFNNYYLYLTREGSEIYELGLVSSPFENYPYVVFFLRCFDYDRELLDLNDLLSKIVRSELRISRRYKRFYKDMLNDFYLNSVLKFNTKYNYGYPIHGDYSKFKTPKPLDYYETSNDTNYVVFGLNSKHFSVNFPVEFGVHPWWINPKNLETSFSFFEFISKKKPIFESKKATIDGDISEQYGFI